MKQANGGFTLIELVVVIVILGILAAVAVPKFFDLSGEAGRASAQATAGAISSSASINYAKVKAGTTAGTGGTIAIVSGTATCDDLKGLLAGGVLPADISWNSSTATITCTNAMSSGCSLKHAKDTTNTTYAVTAMCTNQ